VHRIILTAALTLALVATAPLAAHVVVYPNNDVTRVPACGFTKFVVRVPTEKSIPTTGVRVLIPTGVTVIGTQPKTGGWKAAFERAKGRITAIVWTGGQIAPLEFDEFAFLAAGPPSAATVSWNALQTYADGSIVRWTGNPGSDTPHSQTVFSAPGRPCHHHSM
jgi:uncharacterized protein YcnI